MKYVPPQTWTLALEIAAELNVDPRTVEIAMAGERPVQRRSRVRDRIFEAIERRKLVSNEQS